MGIEYNKLRDILEKKANMAIGHLEQLKCFVPEFREVLDSVLYISETLQDLNFLDTECPHCKDKEEAPAEEPRRQAPGQDAIGKEFEIPGDRLVLFYSDSCEPCQKLKPVLEEVVVEEELNYQPVCVDTEEGLAMAKRYGVQGWPTFFIVKDGIITETNSGYDMSGTPESNKGRVLHTVHKGLGR